MSTLYLIDLFSDTINDVLTSRGVTPTRITGNYVVRVDDDIPVRDPVDLADLLNQKYQGILGTHGLFTDIAYDDMLDAAGVNLTLSRGVCTGDKGSVGLYPTDDFTTATPPVLQTNPHGFIWSGSGAGPVQAIVTYELFTYVDDDPAGEPFQRSFQELPPDTDVEVEVSFDGGATFFSTMNRALVSIPITSRGTQVVLRFTRTTPVSSASRVFIGSWAVLY